MHKVAYLYMAHLFWLKVKEYSKRPSRARKESETSCCSCTQHYSAASSSRWCHIKRRELPPSLLSDRKCGFHVTDFLLTVFNMSWSKCLVWWRELRGWLPENVCVCFLSILQALLNTLKFSFVHLFRQNASFMYIRAVRETCTLRAAASCLQLDGKSKSQ